MEVHTFYSEPPKQAELTLLLGYTKPASSKGRLCVEGKVSWKVSIARRPTEQ